MEELGFELQTLTFENRNTYFPSVHYSCPIPLPPPNKLPLVLLVLIMRINSSKKSPLLSLSLGYMPSCEFLPSFHTILALTP